MSYKEDSELNDIIEGFKMLASDTDGLVNPNDLKEIMETMNMHEKNPFIYNIILNLCSDQETQQKGGIEAGDFISLLDQELNDTSSSGGLQKIFSVFSDKNTNTIPLSVFSQIIGGDTQGDEDLEKIKKLISKPEINGKELNFNEFHEIIKTETPKQSFHENIIYKKKSSSLEGRDKYNNNRNNKNNENNSVEINFNNNTINNNNFNNNNIQDSIGSSEKNIEKYSFSNKKSPIANEENNNYKYSYKKVKKEKIYPNDNSYNNQINYDIDNFNDDNTNNFDNSDNNFHNNNNVQEEKEEVITTKKKYRHMRISKNKEEINDNENDDIDEDNRQTDMSYKNNNKLNKRRFNDIDYEEKNEKTRKENNNDEEKTDIKEKRYHRRYRETKTSTPDKKDDNSNIRKENNEDNNKNSSVYSRYRRKNK